METLRTDIAVIGSGPGGYVAAIRAGQLGQQVICIEKDEPGGVCLNVGCIPSKALISAAKNFHKVSHLSTMGVSVSSAWLDVAQMQTWKQSVVEKMATGVKALVTGSGGQLLQGTATLISPTMVEVISAKGKVFRVEAKSIILATGSRPAQIPGFVVDNRKIHDSTGALAFKELPKHLVVIGGGYIGLELGMAWAKLGAKVSIVEFTNQLLPGNDSELVAVVQRRAQALGMQIYLLHRALRIENKRTTTTVVIGADQGKGTETSLSCDQVLCAVGRKPNSENLNLEKLGIACDIHGFITVDKQQRTNLPTVYAIGDVCQQPMLAHKASKEAEIAVEAILGKKVAMDVVAIPAVIFTDPEIGSVGLSESQAHELGYSVLIGKYSFSALGRALAAMETDGFVKIVADEKTKQILGIHIVGPAATDLISEATLALEMGALLQDMAWTVHPHPTLGEALMEAAKAALGESPHVLRKRT